ncbi:hypothetical protein BH09VER1_BH09VER1_25750 [soil metagenome]
MKIPQFFSSLFRPTTCVCALMLACTTYNAKATNGTWINDSSGLWSGTANWSAGVVADGVSGTADFNTINITADRTISLDSSRTIGNIIFGDATTPSNGWILDNNGNSANVLTLGVSSGFPTITVNNLGSSVATITAQLAGTSGFQKNGTGTLVVTGSNIYSGATRLNAGTLRASDSTTYGASSQTVTSGGLAGGSTTTLASNTVLQLRANGLNDASAQTLIFNNGLQINASVSGYTIDVDRQGGTGTGKTIALGNGAIGSGSGTNTIFNITGGNGYNLQLGTVTIGGGNTNGGLSLNPTTANVTLTNVTNSGSTGSTKTLDLSGTSTGNRVTGVISNQSGTNTLGITEVSKSSTSTWTLTGTSTYTGATTVTAGTLIVGVSGSGALTGSVVSVNAGTLGGTGNIVNAVTVGDGAGTSDAFIAAGNGATGTLSTGDLSFLADGVFQFKLNSTASTVDLLNVSGAVSINSSAQISLTDLGSSTLTQGTVFTIIANDSGDLITGTFGNLAQGGTVTVGSNTFQANYLGGTGNDLTLTVVPEPATCALIGLGGMSLLLLRRRYRNS